MDFNEVMTGVVGLLGPTNVGKSTLINRLVGRKVAITSPKPQTTRKKVMVVWKRGDAEVIFMDTPGYHTPRHELGRAMVAASRAVLSEVDLVGCILSLKDPYSPDAQELLRLIERAKVPSILILNKLDLVGLEILEEVSRSYQEKGIFESIVAISALKGTNLGQLFEAIRPHLSPGPSLFGPDMLTTETLEGWISEIIREKVYALTKDEIPYRTAVTLEGLKEVPQKNMLVASAGVHVETDSQKGILIGDKGAMIKKIGQEARKELEIFLGRKVYLELFVRVEKNWTSDPKAIKKFGYL